MHKALKKPRAKRIELAEKALALSPNCADAYLCLANDREKRLGDKIPLLEEAVKAGRRAIGSHHFKTNVGKFWQIVETRPFMRALKELAQSLMCSSNRHDEAILHYKELLRLDSYDHLEVSYSLMHTYILTDRLAEALKLTRTYSYETSPEITYNRVLVLFKLHGDAPPVHSALRKAIACNPHVVPFFTDSKFNGNKKPPEYFLEGRSKEAHQYVSYHRWQWYQTPGALDWLINNSKQRCGKLKLLGTGIAKLSPGAMGVWKPKPVELFKNE